MPGPILQSGAQVLCAHGGQATPTTPSPRVSLGGQPAVTMASSWTIAGCTLPPPPVANGPCVTAQFVAASTRVTAGGQPVVLLNSQSICAPTGTPLQPVSCQTRVTAQ